MDASVSVVIGYIIFFESLLLPFIIGIIFFQQKMMMIVQENEG